MTTELNIKVLKGLPTAIVERNRADFKLFETLLFIKSIWVDCPMPQGSSGETILAEISHRSTKTIGRRVCALLNRGLLKRTAQGLQPVSWKWLQEEFKIQHNRFYYVKHTASAQLEYVLKAKVIHEHKLKCLKGFKHKRDKYAEVKQIIKTVAQNGSADIVANHQQNCFINEKRGYDEDTATALDTYFSSKEQQVMRGDLNVNFQTIRKMFGYKGKGSVAKLKRSLVYKGVITVEKRCVNLPKYTHTTKAARRTRLGFVKWNESQRELQLIMPDAIEVVPYTHVQANHEANKRMRKYLKELLNARP